MKASNIVGLHVFIGIIGLGWQHLGSASNDSVVRGNKRVGNFWVMLLEDLMHDLESVGHPHVESILNNLMYLSS